MGLDETDWKEERGDREDILEGAISVTVGAVDLMPKPKQCQSVKYCEIRW